MSIPLSPIPKIELPPDDSIRGDLLAINGTLAGFAIAIVAVRVYVRAVVLKAFKADDWLMVVALIGAIGVLACWVGETNLGIGRHTMYVPPSNVTGILHWQFYHSIIIMNALNIVKLSIAFVLLRFVKDKKFQYFIYFMIAFLIAFSIACTGTLVFSCIPPEASWRVELAPSAKCFSVNTFLAIGIWNSVTAIATDVVFVILPIPIIWRLQLSKRTKLSLILILSLGIFASIASMVKIHYQINFLGQVDPYRNNSFQLWAAIELYIGIIAACLPSLRPLVKAAIERSSRSRSTRSYPSSGRTYVPSVVPRGSVRQTFLIPPSAPFSSPLSALKNRGSRSSFELNKMPRGTRKRLNSDASEPYRLQDPAAQGLAKQSLYVGSARKAEECQGLMRSSLSPPPLPPPPPIHTPNGRRKAGSVKSGVSSTSSYSGRDFYGGRGINSGRGWNGARELRNRGSTSTMEDTIEFVAMGDKRDDLV